MSSQTRKGIARRADRVVTLLSGYVSMKNETTFTITRKGTGVDSGKVYLFPNLDKEVYQHSDAIKPESTEHGTIVGNCVQYTGDENIMNTTITYKGIDLREDQFILAYGPFYSDDNLTIAAIQEFDEGEDTRKEGSKVKATDTNSIKRVPYEYRFPVDALKQAGSGYVRLESNSGEVIATKDLSASDKDRSSGTFANLSLEYGKTYKIVTYLHSTVRPVAVHKFVVNA